MIILLHFPVLSDSNMLCLMEFIIRVENFTHKTENRIKNDAAAGKVIK
jgi:hypothetical protein